MRTKHDDKCDKAFPKGWFLTWFFHQKLITIRLSNAPGTGSETLTRMLASTGLNLHDHQCNAQTRLCDFKSTSVVKKAELPKHCDGEFFAKYDVD